MHEYQIQLTFEGDNLIIITCREDEDVISAALRQRVALASECRKGSCGACRGFLEEGNYDELLEHSPHVLSEADEEDGWTLACCLKPMSDLRLDFEYSVDRVAYLEHSENSKV